MEIISKSEPWDAVVVGSGATGGVAARQLTAAGLRVLVLEAGAPVSGSADYGSFVTNGLRQVYRHFVGHNQKVQELHPTYWTTNPDFLVDDLENPYSTPPDKPFRWIRTRRMGGRSLVWDAVTPRLSDYEFNAAGLDGYGPEWPIRHADLDRYYSDLERFLGVHGSREGLAQLPDGEFLDPRPMTPAEQQFKERVDKAFPERRVIISRGLRYKKAPERGAGPSKVNSIGSTLAAATATGLLTIRSGAVVSRVLLDPDGSRARSIEFVDTATGKVEEVTARLVFLCASTIESVRILMNSATAQHPGGIGSASGILGHYLMDHSAGNVYFHMPGQSGGSLGFDLLGSDSIMIPRYQNLNGERAGHLRGFGIWGGIQRQPVPTFLQKKREAFGFLCARSETLPHFDNHVRIDPGLKDRWGIPSVHISCEWKPEDLAIAAAGRAAALEVVEAAGGVVADLTDIFHTPFVTHHIRSIQTEWKLSMPGMFVHEVGGARMGRDPKQSVVDPYCEVWGVRNVFVTDGACWPTSGWQNPTLTEMAITARACDYAAARLKQES